MTVIQFSVVHDPVPQPRQRHRIIPSDNGPIVSNYTPKKHPVNAFKQACILAAKSVHDGTLLDGPLKVDMLFLMPRSKSLIWKTKAMPRIWHDKKPDADNLVKSVFDALSGVMWNDDRQICVLTVTKMVASGLEQPQVKISITDELTDEQ